MAEHRRRAPASHCLAGEFPDRTFVDLPLAIDFVFRRVMQNMPPDKAGVEFHHRIHAIQPKYRWTISGTDSAAKRFRPSA
jgi:hypothetical protein